MGYRGEDLDLRTPQTWSATAADLTGGLHSDNGAGGVRSWSAGSSYGAGRSEPIWVDDTVLACCNHAFEVAQTHRAGEVRLEHLLHAMTRIEAAAEALEARAVRVANLRRESGTIIASEIPVGLSSAKGTPRKSEELEEVLRHAAALAGRRNLPASVEDVLLVLTETKHDLPGLSLLRRNTARLAPRDLPEPAPRERVRKPAGTYFVPEPPRALARETLSTSTDTLQNSRLDALEQVVRGLGSEIASERKALSSLLHELQRDVSMQRDDQSRLTGSLADRLISIEQVMLDRDRGREGDGHLALQIGDRLQSIELNLEKRVTDLSRSWSMIADRILAMERSLQDGGRAAPVAELARLDDRLSTLERAVQASLNEGARTWTTLSERLKSFEAAMTARPQPVVDLLPVTQRLDSIEEAVVLRPDEPEREMAQRLRAVEESLAAQRAQTIQANAALSDEIRSLRETVSAQHSHADRIETLVGDRVQGLIATVERQRSEVAQTLMGPLADKIAQLERASATITADSTHQMALLTERLAGDNTRGLDQINERLTLTERTLAEISRTAGEANTIIADKLAMLTQLQQRSGELHIDQQQKLVDLGESSRSAHTATLEKLAAVQTWLVNRIQNSETSLAQKVEAAVTSTVNGARDSLQKGIGELQNDMTKVTSNQYTLAGSFDQWRQDEARDLGLVSTRLASLEGATARPLAMMETLSSNMEAMHKITAERYHRRNRFWYWLFGTDDWVVSSWPSQAARLESERKLVKTVGR